MLVTGRKCGGAKELSSFLGGKLFCFKGGKRYHVLKYEEWLKVLRCQEMMGSQATDYGLSRLLYLPQQIFFRKCGIRLRGTDLRVSILSTKSKMSSSTNSICVKSVSLELR